MRKQLLAFLIPLVHPDAARSWPEVCARLTETVSSLLADHPPDWVHVFVGVNRGAVLPPLPRGVTVLEVDVPPLRGSIYKARGGREWERLQAVRQDRGLKRFAGLQRASDLGFDYVMNVDADDLVSRTLPRWIETNRGAPGWYISEGWLYRMGSRLAHEQPEFNKVCGSSHIFRTDLVHALCSSSDQSLIPWLLGEHTKSAEILASRGIHISSIGYRAAVYRVGHVNNASLRTRYVEYWAIRKNPMKLLKIFQGARWVSREWKQEFLGVGQPYTGA